MRGGQHEDFTSSPWSGRQQDRGYDELGTRSGYGSGRTPRYFGEDHRGEGGRSQTQGSDSSPDALLLYEEVTFSVPSGNQDDHYRSWREKHMRELDRDYQQFCREREQQFNRDFDEWRKKRHSGEGSGTDRRRQPSGESTSHRSTTGGPGASSSRSAGVSGQSGKRETAQTGSSEGDRSKVKSKSKS